MPSFPLNLHDPEMFVFDAQPELFVLLDAVPLVFTIRGLRHFTPRFRMVGVDIAMLQTECQFRAALLQWTTHETRLLFESIGAKAGATHQANEHQVLLAALMGDIDAAEGAMDRLEHQRRVGLKAVPSMDTP